MALATSYSRSMPDFSFPPKSRYAVIPQALLNAAMETKTAQTNRSPPEFGFPVHQNPDLVTKSSSPISISLTPESSLSSMFLTIPLEIRLQIYSYVLLSHRIHHAHLAPLKAPTSFEGMNTEEFHTVMLRPLGLSMPGSAATTSNIISDSSESSAISLKIYSPTLILHRSKDHRL